MKKRIFISLSILCIIFYITGTTGCNINQADAVEDILRDATLDSFMFSLDGIIYILPVHFSELEENGWLPYNSDFPLDSAVRFSSDVLEPDETASWVLIHDTQSLMVIFVVLV
ncbi:MAG: hypothetical protein LBC73_01340 [Oscillospiraceae bacterium]|nr:hypothetical protein [Oscillospiraceae bacterium]